MTMIFREVKTSLIDNVLGPVATASGYKVIGYQKQSKAAECSEDDNRTVQVYYLRGEFPKNGGALNGPTKHNMTFKLDFTASKSAEGDLSVINDENSSAAEVIAALSEFQVAAGLADESLDELFDIIYQILMDGLNYDLGLSVGKISNRWVGELQKDDPIARGELVTITGSAVLTCSAEEQVTGATPVTAIDIDTNIQINQDPNNSNTGVINNI